MFQSHFSPFKGCAFRHQPQCFQASIKTLLKAKKNALSLSVYTTFIILFFYLKRRIIAAITTCTLSNKWMTAQMQKHIREINEMFADERKSVQEQYKEYAQTYLGRYVQKFFRLFFVLGSVIFSLAIFLILNRHYHWTK